MRSATCCCVACGTLRASKTFSETVLFRWDGRNNAIAVGIVHRYCTVSHKVADNPVLVLTMVALGVHNSPLHFNCFTRIDVSEDSNKAERNEF